MPIAEDILKAAKEIEELNSLKKSIYEAKQEKARLNKNITILQKANEEEQTKYEQDKSERENSIKQLNSSIEQLETKRASIATSTVPEINKLNELKKEVDEKQAKLDREQISFNAKSDRVAKDQAKVEDKKETINQIKELCDRI